MVYRLSVAVLLKYKLPFLDIKIAGLSKRVIEKNLKLNIIKDAGSSSAFFKEFSLGGQNRKKGRTKNMSRRGLANARV